jgi:hypothetical protein
VAIMRGFSAPANGLAAPNPETKTGRLAAPRSSPFPAAITIG